MAYSSVDGDSARAAEEYVALANVLHLRSYNARRVNASNGELLAHHIFQSGYSTIAAVFAVGYDVTEVIAVSPSYFCTNRHSLAIF